MRSAECGLWNINNETRHLVSYPDLVGTIALRCPRWRSPLIGQRNGELSGGGRESAGQRTAQRAIPTLNGSRPQGVARARSRHSIPNAKFRMPNLKWPGLRQWPAAMVAVCKDWSTARCEAGEGWRCLFRHRGHGERRR